MSCTATVRRRHREWSNSRPAPLFFFFPFVPPATPPCCFRFSCSCFFCCCLSRHDCSLADTAAAAVFASPVAPATWLELLSFLTVSSAVSSSTAASCRGRFAGAAAGVAGSVEADDDWKVFPVALCSVSRVSRTVPA